MLGWVSINSLVMRCVDYLPGNWLTLNEVPVPTRAGKFLRFAKGDSLLVKSKMKSSSLGKSL